jgi:oxalate decarboxylase
MTDHTTERRMSDHPSRRSVLGISSAAVATAALSGLTVNAQQRVNTQKAEHDNSISDPGQENKVLLAQNPNSNNPPPTDHGDVGPIWYSFDLVKKRVEEGGWTHEVTQKVLPSSKDIAGVNMRLTAGSFRELHWHTADEWAYVLYGKARVTVMNPDGTMFIGDVSEGDLWIFPAGFPHSIQGLGPDGAEFLLVFNQGAFSEDGTMLLSEWLAHPPLMCCQKIWALARPRSRNFQPRRSTSFHPMCLNLWNRIRQRSAGRMRPSITTRSA